MWHFETSSPSSWSRQRDRFSKSVWRFKKGKSDKDDTSQHQETNKWHEKQTKTPKWKLSLHNYINDVTGGLY